MKVLFASMSSGSRGGGEIFFVSLAKALKRKGIDVEFWTSTGSQMDELVASFGDTGKVLRHPYTNTFERRFRSLEHLIPRTGALQPVLEQWKSTGADVLHFNKQCLEDGLDLMDLANKWDVPQCCTIHITQNPSELDAKMGWLRDWVSHKCLRRYKGRLMATAEPRARELGSLLQLQGKAPMVLNGVEIPSLESVTSTGLETYRKVSGREAKAGPVAVSVGRLEEQKDPLRFIDIVCDWKEADPNVEAYWVGDGSMRGQFDARIKERGASDWIHCLGWQENPFPYLCMADVYIHPARFEGLPFSLLEAMARGKPCVITRTLAEDLEDIPMDTWLLVDGNDQAWLSKIPDTASLTAYAARCHSVAIERFSVDAMADNYIRVYEDLLAGSSH